MATGTRNALVAAVGAAVFGALLLGMPGSFAQWTATASGTPLVITTGTISSSVTGPTIGTATTGTTPSGVVVASGSAGIIPGIQTQTLTYTVTNSAASASPAAISSIHLVSSSIIDATRWADIHPYLVVSVVVNGGAAVTLDDSAITAEGIDGSVAANTNLQVGESVSVVVQFSIPATASSGTIDLLRTLEPDRSSGLSLAAIIDLAPEFTLTQTPIAAP
jgi:hypothetical protein